MAEHEAGERLSRLLLPYRRRDADDGNSPGHELGWWFTDAPPAVVREALAFVSKPPGERPNDQPPEEWLVAQAAGRAGVLAVLPRRQDLPARGCGWTRSSFPARRPGN
jgi:hypothetical protein